MRAFIPDSNGQVPSSSLLSLEQEDEMVQASHGFDPELQLHYAHERAEELRRDWLRANAPARALGAAVGDARRGLAGRVVASLRRTVGLAVIRVGEVISYDEVRRVPFDAGDDFAGTDAHSRAA